MFQVIADNHVGYLRTRNCIICKKLLVGSAKSPFAGSGHLLLDHKEKNACISAKWCYPKCDKKAEKLLDKSKNGFLGLWKHNFGVVLY